MSPPAASGAAPRDIAATFTATGWMGDGAQGTTHVTLVKNDTTKPHSPPQAIKVKYVIGPQKWAGIYWQNKPDNWGDKPGEDFSKTGYKRVTFWARGQNGREMVEFKAGGIDARDKGKKYVDSFNATTGEITLDVEWKKYEIDLTGKDLSSVIGGFCWAANKDGNPNGLTFWLDDIQFEP